MIKLKKIVAVALTAAMCLGLSMTAFAAKNTGWSNDELWSPNYLKEIGPGGTLGNNVVGLEPVYDKDGNFVGYENPSFITAKNAKGQTVDVSWRDLHQDTLDTINGEGKVAEIFQKNGYEVSDRANFIPLLTGDINFDYGVPEGGGQLAFSLVDMGVNPDSVKPGETVYLMQEVGVAGSGVWEIFAAEVGPNYDVTVTVPRSGALVLVKVTPNGTVQLVDRTTNQVIDTIPAGSTVTGNQTGGSSTSTTAASTGTSPKTGEF